MAPTVDKTFASDARDFGDNSNILEKRAKVLIGGGTILVIQDENNT
jgi:hypothetical protein